jgi:hypothetical protein
LESTSFRSRAGGEEQSKSQERILIVLSPAILLAGFFSDPQRGPDQAWVAAFGIFSIALGSLFHTFAQLRQKEF